MRIGIGFTPFETRADAIVRLATLADDLGLERVDVAEGWTHDATVLVAELAQKTSRIALGTCVLSVWGRTPGTLALTAAGLQRLSGGRFTLGLGAGSPPLAEGFHGVSWDRPLRRLRETLTGVRALLDGDRLPAPAGGARALRLGVAPDARVPIALAALSEGSIRLAGELADVWTPFLWSRSRLEQARALLGPTTRASVGVPVALAPDEDEARRMAAWWLGTYVTRMGPLYPKLLGERFGMRAAVEALVNAAPGELPAEAEELAREVTLMGTYDQAGALIAEWFEAGADSVGLVLPPGRPLGELAAIVGLAAAPAVPAQR